MSTETPVTAPATKGDVQWVGFVASTTSFGAWLTKRLVFGGGELPIEVSGMIQYGVPLVMSAAATEWRWALAKRRRLPATPAAPKP